MSHRLRRILFFLAGLFVSVGFDQYTKGLAARRLMGRPAFVLWNGVFELVYSENRGAAFGMLQGKQALFFVIALAVVAVAGPGGAMRRLRAACFCSYPARPEI